MSTKPKMQGAERRAAIIDTAKNLFAERGFRGTTTRDIANAVGVTEPVLYQHFATKRDLYSAIIDQKSEDVGQKHCVALGEAAAANDCSTYFHVLAGLIVHWFREDTAYIRLLFYSALEGHELAQLCYERQVAGIHREVAGYIESQQARGALRADLDPLDAARAFIGMVGQCAQSVLLFRFRDEDETFDRQIDSIIEIFLAGMRTAERTQA